MKEKKHLGTIKYKYDPNVKVKTFNVSSQKRIYGKVSQYDLNRCNANTSIGWVLKQLSK